MNDNEREAIDALSRCTFYPGTNAKRFVRDMQRQARTAPDTTLTPKQARYVWLLVSQYRKQIGSLKLVGLARQHLDETEVEP